MTLPIDVSSRVRWWSRTFFAVPVAAGYGVTIFYLFAGADKKIWTIYLAPLGAVAAMSSLVPWALLGSDSSETLGSPRLAACVISAIAFDVVATVHHDPELTEEANPITRLLREAGYAPKVLLIYGGIAQAFWAAFLCGCWIRAAPAP